MPQINDLKDWLALAAALAALVSAAVLWRLKGEFPTRTEHKEATTRIAQLEGDVQRLKTYQEMAPDHEDMGTVMDRLGRVEGSVNALAETVKGIKDIMERMERPLHLLLEFHLKERSR